MSKQKNDFSNVRALIFDLDGTLIDSKLDLAHSVNATLEELGKPPLPHDLIFSYVGEGAPKLIERAAGKGTSHEEIRRGLEFFIKYYSIHKLDNTTLYPGVREALEALADLPMAVLTNKPVRASQGILDGLEISRFFKSVYGGNSFERKKPDPMGANKILDEFDLDANRAMFVGDSEIDVQTARNSGTWMCGVTYGFGSHRLIDYPPDILLDSLIDLPQYLSGTVAREAR